MKSLLQFILGASLLALIAWGGYKVTVFSYNYGQTLPQEYLFYLSIGVAAFVIAPGIIAASVRKLAKEIRRNRSYEAKSNLYKGISDITSEIIQKSFVASEPEKPSMKEIEKGLKALVNFQSSMVLQAGERALQKYIHILSALQAEPSLDVVKAANSDMISAFRRDLGNSIPSGLRDLMG